MNAEAHDDPQVAFLAALKQIQADPEGICRRRFEEHVWPTGHAGICQLMRYLLSDTELLMRGEDLFRLWRSYAEEMFEAWPEYSGDLEYPIATFDDGGRQYLDAAASGSPEAMWSAAHPYGAARRRLLDFLIEQFTQLQLEAR